MDDASARASLRSIPQRWRTNRSPQAPPVDLETPQGAFNGETLRSVGRLLNVPKQFPLVGPLDSSPARERCPAPAILWDTVLRARTALTQERHLPTSGLLPTARLALVDALESYVESLDDRGYPVPYLLRDELRLQRLTSEPHRGVGPRTTRKETEHGHSVR
jgi:hypothetical protein